ncbi:hypothetical protein EWM64_g2299 [Hericium alpestre]|uniref:chitinase n=1 Tax=Hericium alpestre TaxID=135208 RepID=A0A4Z0A3X2_9AGAM|nr:hypothetical protein EWM64_g2299 [Hericium alpestre]
MYQLYRDFHLPPFFSYWGQNTSGDQKSLDEYCRDDTVDIIMAGFMNVYNSTGGQPEINFANLCSAGGNGVFKGTALPQCQFMTDQIQKCQAAGKAVLLSLGGGAGDEKVGFQSQAQAQQLADTIWNEFLGGNSSTRPLGAAVLDGVDFDVEIGGPQFIADFVNRIRSNSQNSQKKFYVTAAPQCPNIPDHMVGEAIENSDIDAVWVQFYNNPACNMNSPGYASSLDAWMKYLAAHSFNKNMKVFIGSAVDNKAAGQGFVDSATLAKDITQAKGAYASQFGGAMIFDITEAVNNTVYKLEDLTTALRAGDSTSNPTGSASEPAQTASAPASTASGAVDAASEAADAVSSAIDAAFGATDAIPEPTETTSKPTETTSQPIATPITTKAASKPIVSSRFIRPDYIHGRRRPGVLPM